MGNVCLIQRLHPRSVLLHLEVLLIGMSIDDVTHNNCRNVYLNQMFLLVRDGRFRVPM